ncbi:hypothetical protein ACLB2K_042553 [Fragaria x ananassa]
MDEERVMERVPHQKSRSRTHHPFLVHEVACQQHLPLFVRYLPLARSLRIMAKTLAHPVEQGVQAIHHKETRVVSDVTFIGNVKPTVGEDVPLDEPMSEEPEVEVAEIMGNHPISNIGGVPQEKEPEDKTKQSIFEAEISSHTNDDGEPQVRMKGDPGASFPMRDVYANTGQPHGGQGEARLLSLVNHYDQGPDQLKLCPITGRD